MYKKVVYLENCWIFEAQHGEDILVDGHPYRRKDQMLANV